MDNFVIAGGDKEKVEAVVSQLQDAYKIKYLNDISHYLGVSVVKRENRLYLHQTKYIDDLLDRFSMADYKPISTPMDPNHHLLPTTAGYKASADNKKEYQSLLGGCQWLASTTRPNICNATSTLAQFGANPDNNHWHALKHLAKYLKGTRTLALINMAHFVFVV